MTLGATNNTFSVTGTQLTLSGVISGSSRGITKVGSGTLVQSNANSYSGPTTINGGVLSVSTINSSGANSGIGSSTDTANQLIIDGGTLRFTGSVPSTTARLFTVGANGATIEASGSALLTFSSTGQIVTVSGSSPTLTLSGNGSGTLTPYWSNPTSGVSALTKSGASTWTLASGNVNSYSGITTISGGVLSTSSLVNGGFSSGIGTSSSAASNLVIDGGTLRYTGVAVSIDRLFTIGAGGASIDFSGSSGATLTFGNTGNLGVITGSSPTLTLTGTRSIVFNPKLTDPSGGVSSLVMAGSNTARLIALNTYSGGTTISTGTLQAGSATAFGTGSITVTSGAALDLYGQTMTSAGQLTINGTGVSSNGALTNSSSTAATYAGLLNLGSASSIGHTTVGVGEITLSNVGTITGQFDLTLGGATGGGGTIASIIGTGAGGIIKSGNSTWTLNGANTYDGPTAINAGTLNITNASGLGSTVGATTISSEAVLRISNVSVGNENLTINGGELYAVGSTSSLSGNILLGANSTFNAATGNLTLSGNISSGGSAYGFSKAGVGTLILSGTNTFSGVVSFSAASGSTLRLGSATALGNASVVRISALNVTLDVAGWETSRPIEFTNSGYLTSSTGTGGLVSGDITTSSTTSSNIQAGSGAVLTISGVIKGSGTGSVVYVTNAFSAPYGIVVLSGSAPNTYSNASTIGASSSYPVTVKVNKSNPFGTGNITITSGSVLDLNGQTLTSAGTLTLNGTGMSSGGALINSSASSSSYDGSIVLGSASSIVGGTGAISITNTSSGITGSNALTLGGAVGGSITSGIGIGTGGITKQGTGTWTLSGANTYTGTTTISAGTLKAGNAAALGPSTGAGAVSITSGAVLDLNGQSLTNSGTLTIRGTGITSGGALINSSSTGASYSGLVALGLASSIVGDTGTIALTNVGTITGATFGLTLGGTQGGSITSIIGTTSGTLAKEGSGTWTLSGANTYTGTTTISAGTLAITNATGLGTTAAGTTIASTATLDLRGVAVLAEALTINGGILAASTGTSSLSGTITLGATNNTFSVTGTQLTLSGVISGTGNGITKEGSGILVLSNANTYTGTTTINAGILSASSLANGGTASNIGQSTSDAINLVINGGTLRYTGAQITIDRLFTIGANGVTIDNSGTGSITFGNSGSLVTLGTSPTLTLTGSVINSAFLTPVLADPSGGSLSVVKTGTGTWVLNGANTFTGTAIISTGILAINNSDALSSASLVRVDNAGRLLLNSLTTFTKEITLNGGALLGGSTGSKSINAPITLTADSIIANGGGTLTLQSAAVISGNNFGVTYGAIIGSTNYLDQVHINSSNVYTGTTNIISSVVIAGNANAFGNAVNAILLGATSGTGNSGLYATGGITIARDITVQAGSSGTATIGVNGSTTATFSGNITLNKRVVLAGGSNSNGQFVNFSGVISGAQAIDITGTNSLGDGVILSNANTYSGATTIASGRLKLANANALGSSPSISISSATVVFDLNGYDISKPITLAGTGFITNTNTGSTSRITGGITLGGASGYLSPKSGATLIIDTLPIVGTGTSVLNIGTQTSALADGNGTVIIQVANNTFSGGTIIRHSPVLRIGVNDALANTGTISIGDGTSASRGNLDLAGFTVSNAISIPSPSTTLALIYSSQGSANVTGAVTISTATAGAVTFGAYAGSSLTFSGSIIGGTSAIKIGYASGAFPTNTSVGAGAGTVVFSGSAVVNGYSGSTTILNGSTLDIKLNSATTSTVDPAFTSTYLVGTGGGSVVIQPFTSGGSISLGNVGSTLNLPLTLFTGTSGTGRKFADGFANITIGSSSTGNIGVTGAATFSDSVALVSGSNITINSGASISTSQASGLLVVAALGNFINNAGSSALVTTDSGSSDRWIVYSATPASNVFGGLASGNKAYWGSTYASAPPAVIGAGNRYVFGDSPTITTTNAQKTYGNTIDLSTNYSLSGAYQTNPAVFGNVYLDVTSSDIFATLPTISSTGEGSGASVGTYTITASGAVANTGYGFSYANTGVLTVDPATIVLGVVGTKTYDGNKIFTAGPDLVVSGLNVGDVLATATANSAQVSDNGSNYFVSFTLSSGTASNYSLVNGYNATTNSATINKANAYVIIGSGQSSTYGSTPTINYSYYSTASGTGGSAITTATTGTAVITNAPSASSDAATYSLTYASGLSSTNYTFNPAASAVNYIVNPASLVVTGANNSVAYNGSVQTNTGATATVNGSAATITGNTIATGIGGQSFTLSGYGSGTNASTTAYADNLLATAGSGTSASNYNISYTNGGLTINKANAYVIIGSGQSSTYGSTPTITYTFNTNAAGTGSAITTATTGTAVITFNGSNSITARSNAITYGLYYTSGLSSTNYTFSRATGTVDFVVNPAILNLTISKTYDGSSSFSSTNTYTLSGTLYNGDSYPTITPGRTALTNSANAATYNSFTSSNLTLLDGNYTLTGGTVSATIDKANAYVIIGSGQSSFYGSTPSINYTFNTNAAGSGSVISGAAALNGLSGTAVITNSPTSSSGAASYDLTYNTGLTSTNYTFNPAASSVSFTVNPKPIRISADARNTTYGTALSLGTTAYSITSGGLNIGDAISSVTLQYEGSATVADTTNAGTYSGGIVASNATGTGGFNSTNYAITYRAANLVVNKKSVTITNNASSTTYDGVSSYSNLVSSASFTTTPLAGSDVVESVTQRTTVAGNVVSGIAQAGTFISTPSTAVLSTGSASNYSFTYVAATNTVAKANLSVTATPGLSGNVYNGNPYTGTYTTTLLGTDAITVTGMASGTNAGTYTSNLQVSGAALNNYNTPTITNANLVISPKPLTISGQTANNKTYDGTTDTVLSSTNAILVGAVANDPVYLNTNGAYGTFASANVANGIAVTIDGNVLSGTSAGNYTLTQPTGVTANITPATLTVTANNDSKFIGQSDPLGFNGVSYSGFVGTQNSSVLGGALVITRTNSSQNNAGVYTGVLQPSGLSSSNYSISYTNGNFTIVPADTLLVKAINTSATYGSSLAFAPQSVQYLNNQLVLVNLTQTSSAGNTYTYSDGVGGSATFTLAASGPTSSSGNLVVGNYDIVGQNFTKIGNNFNGSPVYNGALTLNKKPLTASTSSVTKVYDGTTNLNALAISLAPVVSGDQVSSGGTGSYAQANVGSSINYTVANLALTGADSSNYYLSGGTAFSGSNGVITPATLTYTATTSSSTYGSAPSVNVGVVTGFVAGENQSNATTGNLLFSTNATAGSNVGGYPVIGSGLIANNQNYQFTQASSNTTALTILPATLTYVATPVTTIAGTVPNVNSGAVTGFVNSENLLTATSGSAFFSTNATAASSAGSYAINGSGLTANHGNYIFVQAPENAAALTITPSPTPAPSGVSITACIVGVDDIKDRAVKQTGLCVAVK